MVFSNSCSVQEKFGTALVVPARTECCVPEHLITEAEHLWAAERNSDRLEGIASLWGRICLLCNPEQDVPQAFLDAWKKKVTAERQLYRRVPSAVGEAQILDPESGLAQIEWPVDDETMQKLSGFDMLLMTATEPTLTTDGHYASVDEIATAWRNDSVGHVSYFYNNRKHGIKTFEDASILSLLKGEKSLPVLDPPV